MTTKNIESRQFRIDSMISIFFILLILPLAALLGFKYYNDEVFPEVSFDVLGDEHLVNEMLKFRNNTDGDHTYSWDFGDSTEIVNERIPVHTYVKEGDYTVTLTVNDQYEYKELIHVQGIKKEIPKLVVPSIVGPRKMYIDAKAVFTCPTKGVTTWAWRVGKSNKVYSNKQSVKFSFSKPGYKKISLVVNGNRTFVANKKVYVRVKPSKKRKFASKPEPVGKKKEVYIPESPEVYTVFKDIEEKEELVKLPSDDELAMMFVKISKGEGDKEKFLKSFYSSNKHLMVICNKELMSFKSMIADVEGRRIVLKEFSTIRKNNVSIISVTVRYKKKRGIKK